MGACVLTAAHGSHHAWGPGQLATYRSAEGIEQRALIDTLPEWTWQGGHNLHNNLHLSRQSKLRQSTCRMNSMGAFRPSSGGMHSCEVVGHVREPSLAGWALATQKPALRASVQEKINSNRASVHTCVLTAKAPCNCSAEQQCHCMSAMTHPAGASAQQKKPHLIYKPASTQRARAACHVLTSSPDSSRRCGHATPPPSA